MNAINDFIKHALANPKTTFGILAAVCAYLGPQLADGQPWSWAKAGKLVTGLGVAFAGAALPDASTLAKSASGAK